MIRRVVRHRNKGTICVVSRCENGAAKKGMCTLHYERLRKSSDVNKGRGTHQHSPFGRDFRSEYTIWQGMKARCFNTKTRPFAAYGARGITVCERWRNSFEAFFADMGSRPSPAHSLDRIDNDGNYEPGNCRWATQKQQTRNRRNNLLVTVDGVTRCASEWSERLGVDRNTVRDRIKRGWLPDVAVTKPSRTRRRI
jgi:hypothetical protein